MLGQCQRQWPNLNPFCAGAASDVYRRQILTSKDGPRADFFLI